MTTYNPNGNNWVSSDSMGKRLLIKAGWSSGEGLGKFKQGSNIHIKVSLKNEKDGIGLKSEKRENDLSLMQCFTFDNILKSKYGKSTGDKSDESSEKQLERGLSRARFGRAVPKEFFNPVQSDDLNKILCKSKIDEKIEEKQEYQPEIQSKQSVKEGNASFFSSFSVFEYFSMKMKTSNIKLDNLNGMIFNRLNNVENFKKVETSELEVELGEEKEGNTMHKSEKMKKYKTVNEKKRKSINTKMDFEVETKFESESETNEIENISENKEAEKKKKSKKIDRKNKKTESEEEKKKIGPEIPESKKKSPKTVCNEEFEITNGNEENNKINSKTNSEENSFSEIAEKLSKKKSKKRKLSESVENKLDKKKKCKASSNKDLSVTNIPVQATKAFVNESMEIIENKAFCPWDTSNINEIEGYKYY